MHLRQYWIDRRVYEYFAVNIAPLLGWRNPTLIYQMGGVGSSSIRNSLFRCRDPRTRLVLMSHEIFAVRNRDPGSIDVEPRYREHALREIEFDKRHFASLPFLRKTGLLLRKKFYAERIYKAFVRSGEPCKVITLVRDPVAANVPLFFQVFSKYAGTGKRATDCDVSELMRIFIDSYPHARPLIWFDCEFKATLGIDIYEFPFPADAGQLHISSGNIDLLILRCELDDAAKSRAIRNFTGLDNFDIVRSNVALEKPYAARYAEFKEALCLPDSLLDDIYTSKYARHFFTLDERKRLRSSWGYP